METAKKKLLNVLENLGNNKLIQDFPFTAQELYEKPSDCFNVILNWFQPGFDKDMIENVEAHIMADRKSFLPVIRIVYTLKNGPTEVSNPFKDWIDSLKS